MLLFGRSVVSDSLQPHGLHTGFPCPSLSPGVCSNSKQLVTQSKVIKLKFSFNVPTWSQWLSLWVLCTLAQPGYLPASYSPAVPPAPSSALIHIPHQEKFNPFFKVQDKHSSLLVWTLLISHPYAPCNWRKLLQSNEDLTQPKIKKKKRHRFIYCCVPGRVG